MKDVRFYLEFPDKATKHKSGKENKGHSGNVVAVFPENRFGLYEDEVESLNAVYEYPNSPVAGSGVSFGFLENRCKRISEKLAREIHPNLFERLDAQD